MYQSRSLWKETRSGRHAGSSGICNKGLSAVTTQLRAEGVEISTDINHLITLNLFVTITNANFDKDAIVSRIHTSLEVKRNLIKQLSTSSSLPSAALWDGTEDSFEEKAAEVGVLSTKDEDIRSLRELITYGLKDYLLTPNTPMPFCTMMKTWMLFFRRLWLQRLMIL